jgi:hypothetical protein
MLLLDTNPSQLLCSFWFFAVGGLVTEGAKIRKSEEDGGFLLSNSRLSARFSSDGWLVGLRHGPYGREAIQAGKAANRMVLFDDLPLYW